jgi:uncharacterized membrane protein
MSSLFTFIGHWHPVVVHLPIGLILGALLLQLLSSRAAYAALRQAVSVLLLAGAFFGLISCCTGYILSTSGDYDTTLVGWHQWMGIGLTFLCFFAWSRLRQRGVDRMQVVLSLLLFGLVIVTGHLGGSLTHGSDYLSFAGSSGGSVTEVDSPIVDVQKAFAYAQVVRPILRDNCYGCHGRMRQKGGLRMDDSAGLFRGGKDGIVVRPGSGSASELIKRLLLPVEDEHHMPPKEKRQLNEREIVLLHWWIDQGASMSRTVAGLGQPDSVRAALLSVQGAVRRVVVSDVPAEEVEAADEKAVEALRAMGILVLPVARGSHWLEAEAEVGGAAAAGTAASGVATGGVAASGGSATGDWVRLLLPLKKQLISLKLGHTGIGDSAMGVIGQCGALRSLDVSGDSVGDAGLWALRGLKELRVLNLVGTKVSSVGVEGLKGLEKLRSVYLYQTRWRSGDWVELRRVMPKVGFDTGGYSMPRLVTDTAVVRQGKK